MKYKLVIFDFDGTLMDTSEGIFYCGRTVMENRGHVISPDTNWRSFIGPPLMDCFQIAFGVDDYDELEILCRDYRELYVTEGCRKAKFYPGIPELLRDLRKAGIHTGIASMKNQNLVDIMCDYFGMAPYVECTEGQGTGETARKADLIKTMCGKFGIDVSECVLIGDTHYDREGAIEAGCDGIMVNYGFGYNPGDENTVSSVDEIRKIIFG